jgi:hypothetical protein
MAIAVSASAVALTALVAVASDGLPHIDRQGRRLREITWKSLDYPSGPVLPYEARASEEAIVDGVSYDTECASLCFRICCVIPSRLQGCLQRPAALRH